MNELFGLSMTYIMIGLLVVLAIALGTVGWVLVRNRIMFMVGVRNIPRRRAQTTLIIIGLMLSTLIISAAFSIGDTVDYSITNQAYTRLASIDELVAAQTGEEDDSDDPFEGQAIISPKPIPEEDADAFIARFEEIDGVDGATTIIRTLVPVTSATQTEPVVLLVGVDGDRLSAFPDIETTSGTQVAINDLGRDEIYVNESAADELDVRAGDRIETFIGAQSHAFTVKAVVEERLLTGAAGGFASGMAIGLDRAQELLSRPGEVDYIVVSNDGGVRQGIKLSDDVTPQLNSVLRGCDVVDGRAEECGGTPSGWIANDTKDDLVQTAADISSFITTFFTILGLFSIAAGMMLIFLIFVMLAAERKMEMGMIRAVGTKRNHLVQMFMSEGMVYNVGAALVGVGLGIVASLVMVGIMARLFANFDFNMTFHVTPRSLIVSYTVGVVLTFLTVVFSSWRIGALNIVSAIRDVPDPAAPRVRPSWRNLASFLWWTVFKASSWRAWGEGLLLLGVGVLGIILTVALFMGAAGVYQDDSALFGTLSVLLGIGGGFAAVVGVALLLIGLTRLLQFGGVSIVIGIPLILLGFASEQYAPYLGGVSLILLGIALTVANIGLNPRVAFTTVGIVLIVFWLLAAGNHIPPYGWGGDIELFFLSGLTMVLAGTFVLVYNADLILALLTLTGGLFSSLVPSIKTAVAYPLSNRFRTGMTIAMISLVMFALVMMSTMNENFDRIFLSDDALGGYDVAVIENPNNPIDDVAAAVSANDGDASGIAGDDRIERSNGAIAQARAAGETDFHDFQILGVTAGFAENNGVTLSGRARGYESDEAVWRALAEDPDKAVIDGFSVGGVDGGFDGGGFIVDDIDVKDEVFEPANVQIRNASSGVSRPLKVIGVIDTKATLLFSGLFVSGAAFESVYGEPESSVHYVRLNEGADARDTAREIERTLLRQGVQADSLRKIIDDEQALSRGFLYVIQGFMGLGLFVGIAAVGVIAFRTVVERRQQIGMLRAIGYTRGAVALSFLMESSFVTLLGIFSGIGLGLLLANQLVSTDDFVPGGVDSFYIPWLQISVIGGFAFLASLIMTIIPSRQAASIPIAEALRYE